MSMAPLAEEIRQIYRSDPAGAPARIRAALEGRFGSHPPEARTAMLDALAAEFEAATAATAGEGLPTETLSQMVALLLGRVLSPADLASPDLLERLAESLNTVFDMLNQLVRLIDMNLLGEGGGEATIRHVIGSRLQGEAGGRSLESYLGQIRKAFLIANEAFKQAAQDKVGEILQELNPEALSADVGGGLKFGPLRKAELYTRYEERFKRCARWYDSGRFMEDFLRGFENHYQKLSAHEGG